MSWCVNDTQTNTHAARAVLTALIFNHTTQVSAARSTLGPLRTVDEHLQAILEPQRDGGVGVAVC